MQASPKILFYADSFSTSIAANRLRLLQPMAFLQGAGLSVGTYAAEADLQDSDIILFSRSHTRKSVAAARAAKAAGKTISFDICDNLFHGYQSWHDRYRAGYVAEMIRQADFVTTPTPKLAEMLAAQVPESKAVFRVIPDALEDLPAGDDRTLAPMRAFLGQHKDALHCVWFGSSTKNLAGLVHLDRAVAALAQFGQRHPVTLTIISDTYWQYRLNRRRWRIPSFYHGFDVGDFGPALGLHDVAIIPVENNLYTAGKSINRPATALLAGLGVITDPLPSYEELRPFIEIGDWDRALEYYAGAARVERLAEARAYLQTHYAPDVIGRKWLGLVNEMAAKA